MLTVLATGLVVTFLYLARNVIVPIALAVLLSFLLAPAVCWLRRGHLGRVTAATLTVLIAFLAMLGFVAIVLREISSLAKQLPEYRSNFEDLRQFYVIVTDAVGVFARSIAPFISTYSTIYKDKGLATLFTMRCSTCSALPFRRAPGRGEPRPPGDR